MFDVRSGWQMSLVDLARCGEGEGKGERGKREGEFSNHEKIGGSWGGKRLWREADLQRWDFFSFLISLS